MVKKRKAVLGRTGKKGGNVKPGTKNKHDAQYRDSTAIAAEARAAANQAADSGASAQDLAAAAAKARVAARDAARAKQKVAARKPAAVRAPSASSGRQPRSAAQPPQTAAPEAAAARAGKRTATPDAPAPRVKRPKPGRPSLAPKSAGKVQQRQLTQRRYYLKKIAAEAAEAIAEDEAGDSAAPIEDPWARIDPEFLDKLVMVGVNMKRYKPSVGRCRASRNMPIVSTWYDRSSPVGSAAISANLVAASRSSISSGSQ